MALKHLDVSQLSNTEFSFDETVKTVKSLFLKYNVRKFLRS